MEENLGNITVICLQEQIEKSFELRKEYETAKRVSDLAFGKFQVESKKAASMLENLGLDKFHTDSGTFTYGYQETYRVPKSPAHREAFFSYLKEKGVYDEMVSVNSQTLNSFAKAEEKNALDEGNFDFQIPGIIKSAPILKPIMRRK